jgi:hypothetical protein
MKNAQLKQMKDLQAQRVCVRMFVHAASLTMKPFGN